MQEMWTAMKALRGTHLAASNAEEDSATPAVAGTPKIVQRQRGLHYVHCLYEHQLMRHQVLENPTKAGAVILSAHVAKQYYLICLPPADTILKSTILSQEVIPVPVRRASSEAWEVGAIP
jgi:hypothetical protein